MIQIQSARCCRVKRPLLLLATATSCLLASVPPSSAIAFAFLLHARSPTTGTSSDAAAGARFRARRAAATAMPAEPADPPPAAAAADDAVPHLAPSTLRHLVECAAAFAAAHGLQVAAPSSSSDDSDRYTAAPISLLPQAYPADQFAAAQALAAPFNALVENISRDGAFLKDTLRDVRGVDDYTGQLLELYEEIYLGERKGAEWGRHARAADRLGILRSDYMLHRAEEGGGYAIKQVELNTIASSFAGLASVVARLHAFLTARMAGELGAFLDENERAVVGSSAVGPGGPEDRGVPLSPAMARLPAAVAVAFERYRARHLRADAAATDAAADVPPVVLFVVQPGETNTVDQRLLEFALWDAHQIPAVRLSLAEVYDRVTLDEDTGRLALDHGDGRRREVAVVYFRAGYAPADYPAGRDGAEWQARERLERGAAAKCPCLGYHLAGTKKVQQELARPGVVERFVPPGVDGTAARVRGAFAGLFSLGGDAGKRDLEAVEEVLCEDGGEERYVLKPQREGGGYNYYGTDLAAKLRENCTVTTADDEGGGRSIQLDPALAEYILMERLFPPRQRAVLLRGGRVEGAGPTISELGCFGTIVAAGEGEGGEGVVHNEYAGFLLRTKFSGVDEGGVASGFATLSSPYLC